MAKEINSTKHQSNKGIRIMALLTHTHQKQVSHSFLRPDQQQFPRQLLNGLRGKGRCDTCRHEESRKNSKEHIVLPRDKDRRSRCLSERLLHAVIVLCEHGTRLFVQHRLLSFD